MCWWSKPDSRCSDGWWARSRWKTSSKRTYCRFLQGVLHSTAFDDAKMEYCINRWLISFTLFRLSVLNIGKYSLLLLVPAVVVHCFGSHSRCCRCNCCYCCCNCWYCSFDRWLFRRKPDFCPRLKWQPSSLRFLEIKEIIFSSADSSITVHLQRQILSMWRCLSVSPFQTDELRLARDIANAFIVYHRGISDSNKKLKKKKAGEFYQ